MSVKQQSVSTGEMKVSERPVIVTTVHRGVFFGYLGNDYQRGDAVLDLKRARNVIYWPKENRGFMGLAERGPQKGARIGPAVETIELRDITSVIVCSDGVAEKFEAVSWPK